MRLGVDVEVVQRVQLQIVIALLVRRMRDEQLPAGRSAVGGLAHRPQLPAAGRRVQVAVRSDVDWQHQQRNGRQQQEQVHPRVVAVGDIQRQVVEQVLARQ